jgi:hypothetical protein
MNVNFYMMEELLYNALLIIESLLNHVGLKMEHRLWLLHLIMIYLMLSNNKMIYKLF